MDAVFMVCISLEQGRIQDFIQGGKILGTKNLKKGTKNEKNCTEIEKGTKNEKAGQKLKKSTQNSVTKDG